MKHSSSTISACRHCQFYSPQGRRGGHCKKLNVLVKSHWDACSFATPPFAASWQELESITTWTQKALIKDMKEDVVLAVEGSLNTDLFETHQPAFVSTASRAGSSSWM